MSRRLMASSLLLAALTACSAPAVTAPAPSGEAPTAEKALAAIATGIIRPTYEALDAKAALLQAAIEAYVAAPSADTRKAAQDAWRAAREPWEKSESHLIGPVSDQELDPKLDSWPVNVTDLEKTLASRTEFDAAFIAGLPDEQKGFHAIEAQIFGETPAELTEARKSYLLALTADFKANTAALAAAWRPGAEFAEGYAAPGPGKAFTSTGAAIEETLNAMGEICEEVASSKIAVPMDAQDPALEESHFSDNSLVDFGNNIAGVRAVYEGTGASSLSALVAAKDPAANAKFLAALTAAEASLKAVPVSFGAAVTGDAGPLEKAQAAILELNRVLKKDVFQALTGKVSADAT